MSSEEQNIIECRECLTEFNLKENEKIELDQHDRFTCDDCTSELESLYAGINNKWDAISGLNIQAVLDVIESTNNENMTVKELNDKVIPNLFKYITDEQVRECKEEFLECGHLDEDFIHFLIYPFFANLGEG